MYVWDMTKPKRDGDLESSISKCIRSGLDSWNKFICLTVVIHEYAHGISTRLTGGPGNSNCLRSGESGKEVTCFRRDIDVWWHKGGLGEGWGDVFGILLRHKAHYTRNDTFLMGSYCFGGKGIRKYPYTSNMTISKPWHARMNGFLKES